MRSFFLAAIASFALTAAACATVTYAIWDRSQVDSPPPWVCKMCRPVTPAA
jgi:hypothetical protein